MFSTAERIQKRSVRILLPGPIGRYYLDKLRNNGILASGKALLGERMSDRLKLEIEDKLYKDFSYEGPFAYLIEVEGEYDIIIADARRFWFNQDTPEHYAWFKENCRPKTKADGACYPPRRKGSVTRYYDYSEIAELLEEEDLKTLFPEGIDLFLSREREALFARKSAEQDPIRRSEGWLEDRKTLLHYLREMVTVFSDDITLFLSKARKAGSGQINLYLRKREGEMPLEGMTAYWGSHFIKEETDIIELTLFYDPEEDVVRVLRFGPYFGR